MQSKYILVGAGLSSLTTAHMLRMQGEEDFIILEGKKTIGGRIRTEQGVDLGATWFQDHHTHVTQLLEDLGVPKYEQYSKGKSVLVYNTMAPAHYFESDHDGPSAYRIAGGSIALIKALAKPLISKIILDCNVTAIDGSHENLQLKTSKGIFSAQKVVSTIPPKLATGLQFNPKLPSELTQIMQRTHTWMSNAIKVGITFKSPFWRKEQLSGTIIGQVGPVIELYDHASESNDTFALMGFVNEGLRDVAPELRKERILAYLQKYLGNEVRDYLSYFEKDWSKDTYTSCEQLKSVYMSPQYGNSAFGQFYLDNRLLFSGTETSPIYGGYLDGAVASGMRAARKLLDG